MFVRLLNAKLTHTFCHCEEAVSKSYFPSSSFLWCKWQRDQVHCTSSFPAAVMEEIFPTFDALWDEKLLATVQDGLSQNDNEAVNHLVWDI